MKTTYRYIAAAFAAIAAVACAKQEISQPDQEQAPVNTYEYVLNVSQEGTKTTMDGLSILWSEGDDIAVLVKEEATGNLVSAAKAGAQVIADGVGTNQATFNLAIPEGYTPFAAVYPFDSKNSAEDENKHNQPTAENPLVGPLAARFYIPAEQTGIKDNLPLKAFPMVGSIENGQCYMRNAGALIKFEITGTDVVSLKFEGNKGESISGRNYYYIESGAFKRTTGDSDTSVTLVPSGEVFEPGVYYFTVAPQKLTEGFTLTVTNRFGQQAVRKSTTEFNIKRNTKYTNFGSEEGWIKDIYTGAAGDLGTADGTTATLYGVLYDDDLTLPEGDTYGFETSVDGVVWTRYEGELSQTATNAIVYTASLSGLVPGVTTYYRAYYTKASGITTYGKAKPVQTYADAESVRINLYSAADETYWPFTNLTYGEDLKKGTSSAALHAGEPLTLTTSDGSFVAKATSGFWLNTNNGCLTMKVKSGDYIKFPVIAGKKPVSVTLVLGGVQSSTIEGVAKDNAIQGLPSIWKVAEDMAGIAGGGDQWDPRPAFRFDSHNWNLENTDDSQYEIHFNAGSNAYIAYLEVVYSTYDGPVMQETVTNNIAFADENASKLAWPFMQAWVAGSKAESPVGPLFTSTWPDFAYRFHVAGIPTGSVNSGDKAIDYWRHTGGAGLRFGGAVGDYMEIMPVAGYKLTYIKIRSGKRATKYSVKDTSGNIVSGGDITPVAANDNGNEILEFTLTGTTANTEYRLVMEDTEPASIREMWITYELVK